MLKVKMAETFPEKAFQSPRSGKFESNLKIDLAHEANREPFQSPRSGKFESN